MRGYPKDPVYGAMKAAAAHFTTCLAVDLGRHGIRVNGIGTDLAQTPQVDYLTGYEDVDELWASWAPVGRVGWPEDQARVALFLASDQSGVRHRPQHSRRRRHQSRWRMALLAAGGPLRQQIEEPVTTPDETVDVLVAGSAGGTRGRLYRCARRTFGGTRRGDRPVRRHVRLLRRGRDVVSRAIPCSSARAATTPSTRPCATTAPSWATAPRPNFRRPTCAAAPR